MPYGLIACFTTKPGQRDTVVAQLTTAGRELSALGCHQYIVRAACADEVTVWDCHGANRAGLTTAWISRLEHEYSPVFAQPDVTGQDLLEAAHGLLSLSPG